MGPTRLPARLLPPSPNGRGVQQTVHRQGCSGSRRPPGQSWSCRRRNSRAVHLRTAAACCAASTRSAMAQLRGTGTSVRRSRRDWSRGSW